MEPVNEVWVMSQLPEQSWECPIPARQLQLKPIQLPLLLWRVERTIKSLHFHLNRGCQVSAKGLEQHLRAVKDSEAKSPGTGRGRVPAFGSKGGVSAQPGKLFFFFSFCPGRKEDDSDGEKMSGKGWKCEGVWTHPRTFSHLEKGQGKESQRSGNWGRQRSKGRNRGIPEANGPTGEGTKSNKAEEHPEPEERWVAAREIQDGAGKTR